MLMRVVALTSAAAFLVAGVATGHLVERGDPDDVTGRFDISRSSVSHSDKLVLEMVVRRALKRSDFTGGNFFRWELDTTEDDATDYAVHLVARRRDGILRMRCQIHELGNVGQVFARSRGRIDGRRGLCPVDPSLVAGLPEQWWVATKYGEVFDRAPNSGAYYQH